MVLDSDIVACGVWKSEISSNYGSGGSAADTDRSRVCLILLGFWPRCVKNYDKTHVFTDSLFKLVY